jgi:hypothetical protein
VMTSKRAQGYGRAGDRYANVSVRRPHAAIRGDAPLPVVTARAKAAVDGHSS